MGSYPETQCRYFNKSFLLHKIGQKIGRVIKIDSTTQNVERGQYTRLCVEVDLTKSLLSKFRLNGRTWGIQYEGLKMICFKCGWQGHREENCVSDNQDTHIKSEPDHHASPTDEGNFLQQESTYGSWMLVKKPPRRCNNRQQSPANRNRGGQDRGDPNNYQLRTGSVRVDQGKESEHIQAPPRSTPPLAVPEN